MSGSTRGEMHVVPGARCEVSIRRSARPWRCDGIQGRWVDWTDAWGSMLPLPSFLAGDKARITTGMTSWSCSWRRL